MLTALSYLVISHYMDPHVSLPPSPHASLGLSPALSRSLSFSLPLSPPCPGM